MGKLITGTELRTFASPQDIHIDALLTDFAVSYGNTDLVGGTFFPDMPVKKQSGKFARFEASRKNLRIDNTLRAPRTASKVVDYEADLTSQYFANEHSLAAGVDDQERDNADTPVDPDQRATARALIGVLLDRENRIATLMRTAANYPAANSVILAGVNQWSDPANSNPKADVDAGRDVIVQASGVLPNYLELPWAVVQKLKIHNKITDAFKYTNARGMVNIEQLKDYFEIENIVISGALKNTANEGAAAAITRIWGKDVWMGFVDPNSSPLDGISFGKTFRWLQNGQPRLVRNYYEPKARTTFYEVTEATDEKIAAKEVGYLIGSAIA